ncbi:MAG: hypothetical protein ACKESB_03115 [Candidatus Hodgkinia cicadicola]
MNRSANKKLNPYHIHNSRGFHVFGRKSVVLNERYEVSSGHIRLEADGLIMSDASRMSVVAQIHEVWVKSDSADVGVLCQFGSWVNG